MFVNLGVFRHTVISTNYSRLMGHLLTFPKFRTIGHMSVVARKWIIIIQAKYLMFPLLEQVYKQMRHLQFIVRTITWRPFPTVGPGLATSPGAGREPAQGPDHHGAHKHTLGPPLQSHTRVEHVVSIYHPQMLFSSESPEIVWV